MGQGRRKNSRRWHKAVALLPLVALSGAWSANAAPDGAATEPVAETGPLGTPAVPDEIFSQPASVALPDGFSAPTGGLPAVGGSIGSPGGSGSYGSTTVNGIPTAALQAYQTAAAILNQADPACNIDWTLIAAIGRVESDHGRFGGNALDDQGTARPGIYGIPLDGSNGTARITDTDGGQFDDDPVFDRAVGPMQFIPGTWAVAGVDANQDGMKDPQNVYDAATASAVYLCAGDTDLSSDAGRRTAVYRYNHSYEYVDLVLSIAAAYAGGNYSPVPNGTASSTTLTPVEPSRQAGKAEAQQQARRGDRTRSTESSGSGSTGGSRDDGGTSSDGRDQPEKSRDNGGDDSTGTLPEPSPTASPSPEEVVEDTVETTKETVKKTTETIGLAKATDLCAAKLEGTLYSALVDACAQAINGKTLTKAESLLTGTPLEVVTRLELV